MTKNELIETVEESPFYKDLTSQEQTELIVEFETIYPFLEV